MYEFFKLQSDIDKSDNDSLPRDMTIVMAGSAGPHQTYVAEKFLTVHVRAGSPYRRS
jgi:hypothetical protein